MPVHHAVASRGAKNSCTPPLGLPLQEDMCLVRPMLPEGTDINSLPKSVAIPHVMSAASVVSGAAVNGTYSCVCDSNPRLAPGRQLPQTPSARSAPRQVALQPPPHQLGSAFKPLQPLPACIVSSHAHAAQQLELPFKHTPPQLCATYPQPQVFSFTSLHEKLGQPLSFLHAPVPGLEEQLGTFISRAMTAITAATPMWRNNWSIVSSGVLDQPAYGNDAAAQNRLSAATLPVDQIWLKTEYETLR